MNTRDKGDFRPDVKKFRQGGANCEKNLSA